MEPVVVYKAIHDATGMIYVGATADLKVRIREHVHDSLRKRPRTLLASVIARDGVGAFSWHVLWSGSDREELWRKEQEWIAELGSIVPNGLNRASGGHTGMRHHPDSKKKLSISNRKPKSVQCWAAGLTKETDERIARRAQSQRGSHKTAEHRENLSKAKIGKPNPRIAESNAKRYGENSATSKRWKVVGPDGSEVIVLGLSAFAKEHGLNRVMMERTARLPGVWHRGFRAEKLA